jgi:hypothetical protein
MLKIQFFWHITPCRLVNIYRRFESTTFLQISSALIGRQGVKNIKLESSYPSAPGASNQNGRQQRKLRIKYTQIEYSFNPLNAKLNPFCHMLALLGAHPILHVSRIKVNLICLVLCVYIGRYTDTNDCLNVTLKLLEHTLHYMFSYVQQSSGCIQL